MIAYVTQLSGSTYFNDLWYFDPKSNSWTNTTTKSRVPIGRYALGMTSTPDGMLYVFGGSNVGSGGESSGGEFNFSIILCIDSDQTVEYWPLVLVLLDGSVDKYRTSKQIFLAV